jgi:hypothetical protein
MRTLLHLTVFLMILPAVGLYAQGHDIEIGQDDYEEIGLPVDPYRSYSYSQSIFLQEELDIDGQRITKIAYYYNGGRQWSDDITIYMAHTSLDELYGFEVESLTLVFEGDLSVMNEPGWVEIPLMYPFEYNNNDNLLIAIKENTPGYRLNSKFYSSAVDDNKSILASKDISPPYDVNDPPATGSVLSYRPNIRFWFDELPEGPAIALIPSQLYFQYIRENESKSLNVDIYNTGNADLVIDGFEASGLPFQSSFTGSIAPGQSQNVSISFNPEFVGDFLGYGGFTGNFDEDLFQVLMEGYAVHQLSIIETFQETTFPPDEWSVDENSWTRRGFGGYIGGGNARLQHPGQPGRLITPKINILEGDQLVFFASEFQDGELTVSYSPDMENWTELANPSLTRSFKRYIVDLDDAQGANYIGFSGVPQVYLDYIITPPVYQQTPPQPSGQPVPADGYENAFVTQRLEWGQSVFANGYRVYVGTDNPPTNVVDGEDAGALRHFTSPVLEYGTTYYWQIVPYNSYGDAEDSPVWSFETISYDPVTQFPYEEGFEDENGMVPPAGWINRDGHWETTSHSNSGDFAAKARWNHPIDAVLITPPLQLDEDQNLDLTFYWKNGDIFNKTDKITGHDSLYVEVSDDYGQSWNPGLMLSAESVMDDFLPAMLPLESYAGEEIYVRFRHSTDSNNQFAKSVAIDDISVQAALEEPVIWVNNNSFNAGSIPENTWVTSEEFVIRNLGADILTISDAYFTGEFFTTTFDAEDVSLVYGEEYIFSLSFEPFEEGDFTGSFVIESNGGTVEISLEGTAQHVPLFTFEGFESGVFPPLGWMVHDEDGDEIDWMLAYANAIPPYNGQHCAISFSYVYGIGDLTPDNWLVSSKIEVGDNQEFAFWVATELENYPYEHYKVYLSTTTNRLDQFDVLLWEETLQPDNTSFSERVFDLSDYAGMDIYIAFYHTESVGQYLVKIDDLEIRDKDTEQIPGDANCDGVVNVLDIIAIVNYYTGTEPDPFCFENADVNGDGVINILDVIGTVGLF